MSKVAPYFRLLPPARFLSRAAVSLTPGAVARAYGASSSLLGPIAPVKLGFVSLGGATSLADVAQAFSQYGLPAPKVTKINVGGASESPDPGGADVENCLDVCCQGGAWAMATGQPADITIAVAPNSDTGIGDGFRALADAGVEVPSISWGSPRSRWNPQAIAYTEAALAYCVAKNCWPHAASGDNSENDGTGSAQVDYPCSSAFMWAVGGTRLSLAADGSIAGEQAWGDGRPGDDGGGGGFDTSIPKPTWQIGVPGNFRGVPDSSANADPLTGYLIVSGGKTISVGGTSGAAPLTAAIMGLIRGYLKHAGKPIPNALGFLYRTSPFNDITTGSNGLPAAAGWDAATGMGSPNVAKLLAAFTGVLPPIPPPVVQPPPPPPPVSTLPSLPQVLAAVNQTCAMLAQRVDQGQLGRIEYGTIQIVNGYVDQAIRRLYQP